jgi:photosystem II stability/assembly factor-like uncharacterized protein
MRSSVAIITALLISGTCYCQHVELQWLNPHPTSNEYQTLLVFDSLTIVALGDAGNRVRSDDGGVSWGILSNRTSYDIHYSGTVMSDGTALVLKIGRYDDVTTTIERSTDSCATWSQVFDAHVGLYSMRCFGELVFTVGINGTVLMSSDRGISWNHRGFDTRQVFYDIAMHNSGILTVCSSDSIYTSADTGRSWQAMASIDRYRATQIAWCDNEPTCMTYRGDFYVFDTSGALLRQRVFPWEARVAIQDRNVIVLSGDSLWYSPDCGSTWIGSATEAVRIRRNDVRFNGKGSLVSAGSALEYSLDMGQHWRDSSSLPRLQYRLIGFANNDSGIVVSGSGDVFRTVDGGRNWSSTEQKLDAPRSLLYLDATDEFMLCTNTGLWRSDDIGISWRLVDGLPDADFAAIARLSPGTLAVATEHDFYRSSDAGRTWQHIAMGEIFGIRYIRLIAFADHSFGAVYTNGGRLYITRDGGETWSATGKPELPHGGVALGCLPPETVYLGGSFMDTGYLHRSSDAGLTWKLWWGNDPQHAPNDVRTLEGFEFRNPSLGIVIGTPGVVSVLTGHRNVWKEVGWVGLSCVSFPSDSIAYVAGGNGAILKVRITGMPTMTEEVRNVLPNDLSILHCSPHPILDQTEIMIRLAKENTAALHLTDLLGRRLRVLYEGLLPAGESRINAMLGNLPSGVYRLLFTSPTGVDGRSIVVLR